MALPHAIDTRTPVAVSSHAQAVFAELGWPESAPLIKQLFTGVSRAFAGGYPGYLPLDMRYHNYEHTLQAAVCVVDILRGRRRAGAQPDLVRRDAELTLMAVLLHDSGFLKQEDDAGGTGAKYTFVHERRSCDFARRYLPAVGASADEIEDICSAIRCTGPRNRISAQSFRRPEANVIACILVTADYLAQMSAPDYPDKLPLLFREFQEAFEHEGIPPEKRPYRNVLDLFQKTPAFWHKLVLPMLETEAHAQIHFLAITGQPNPYIGAVEANLAEIQRRSAAEVGRS
jgi:hypothetical protein